MASKVFSETLADLSSEKAKDRSQGLEDVGLFLTVERNLDWINQEPKRWLKLLQAVFQIVVDDQKAYVKKPLPAGLKRLRDSAQVVRTIIEKATADIPKKAFKAVFDHIVSIIVVRGELFQPVALEYIKSLRTVLAYQPHLDHLEVKQWTHAVSLAFSAVLGDPIRSYEIVQDKFDDDEETEQTESTAATQSRKRKAAGPLLKVTNEQNASRASSPAGFRSASQDVIELMGCVEVLFSASAAPLTEYGEALLSKLVRFFRTYPNETSAHLPAVIALNRLVQHIYFNNKALLASACAQLWPTIASLWPTKNTALKEQVVMLSTALLPFVIYRDGPAQTNLVQSLYNLCLSETDSRWGIEPLDIDHLLLGKTADGGKPSVFQFGLIRSGHGFTAAHALSWTVIELAAACLLHLDGLERRVQPDIPPTPSGKGKKRKIDAPLENVLDRVSRSPSGEALLSLQILVAYLDLNLSEMDTHTIRKVVDALQLLLSHESPQIQDWSLLALAVVADAAASKASAELSEVWVLCWTVALRRLGSAVHGRAAALLARTCKLRQRIAEATILSDLEAFGRDLEITGPVWPFDTACDLLSDLLELARSDMRIYRLNLPEKIYNRMVQHWSLFSNHASAQARSFGAKPKTEFLIASALYRLIVAVAGIHTCAWTEEPSTLPDCSIVAQRQNNLRHREVASWYFQARLSPKARSGRVVGDHKQGTRSTTSSQALRIVSYLRNTMTGVTMEAASGGDAFWDTIAVERARKLLDIAILSLRFEARLDACQVVRAESNSELSVRIVQRLLPKLRSNRWSLAERAYLIAGLSPILIESERTLCATPALIAAGPSSGIRGDLLKQLNDTKVDKKSNHPDDTGLLWSQAQVMDMFAKAAHIFEILLSAEGESELVGHQKDDDEFGPIKTTTSVQMTGRALNDAHQAESSRTCLSVALRTLASMSFYEAGGSQPARLKQVVKNLLEGTGARLALVGPHLLAAVESGFVLLSPAELEDIFDRIGGELLPSYEYARSPDTHHLVLTLLKATTSTWGRDGHMEMTFVDKARRLSGWFTAQILSENIPSPSTRMTFIELAAGFLAPELSNHAWGHENEPGACISGVPIPPVSVLIRLLADEDFVVRFRLASVLGKLCAFVHSRQQQEYAVWESIAAARGFDLGGAGFENNISLLLAYANIMVASDYFRANAYHPIVICAALDPSQSTSLYVSATLTAVASSLGLSNLASLYTFLAPYTIAEQIIGRQETLTIPDPMAFGFGSKRELYGSSFAESAAMILAGPRPQVFDQIATHAGLSRSNGLRACMPIYIPYKLTAPLPTEEADRLKAYRACVAEVDSHVQELAKEAGQTVAAFIRALQGTVLYRMFSFIWEPEYHTSTLKPLLEAWPEAKEALAGLLDGIDTVFKPNVLSPPDVALADILRILRSDHPIVKGVLQQEATLYTVLSRLSTAIAAPHFVSQQLRMLYNLTICIAITSQLVSTSGRCLRMLLQRLSRLLEQTDLFRVASSLFRWTLRALVALPGGNSSQHATGQAIADAAVVAVKHSASDIPALASAAAELLKALNVTLGTMIGAKGGHWRDSALTALCMWPDRLPLHDKLSLRDFQRVIYSPCIRFDAAHIMQHLKALLKTERWSKQVGHLPRLLWHFASRWKRSGRQEPYGDRSGREAFADLLMLSRMATQPPSLTEIRDQGAVQQQNQHQILSSITEELARYLDVSDLGIVSAAFEALTGLFAESADTAAAHQETSDDLAAIAAAAARSPLTLIRQHAYSLADLNTGEEWLSKAQDRSAWQRGLAEMLVEALAMRDEAYATLRPALDRIRTLPSALLPHLVHALLLSEAGQRKARSKEMLSRHFTKVLEARSPVSMDVIDCVIALRAYAPTSEDDGETNRVRNRWLSVPWTLLAEVAGTKDKPCAALLFLELARDAQVDGVDASEAATQELLYSVYSRIGEPDGFYSIQATNPQSGLLRQLEHEGRWIDALAWHGAHMQASGTDTSQIAYALSKSDLPKLAMTLLLPSHATTPATVGNQSKDLQYHLAWKTEAWDIPLVSTVAEYTPSAPIFDALRTIHQSLDATATGDTIFTELDLEIDRALLWFEAGAQERQTSLENIVTLREIHRTWLLLRDTSADFLQLDPLPDLEFELAERCLSVRLNLLRRYRLQEGLRSISDEHSPRYTALAKAELCHLQDLANRSRQSGRLQSALNALLRAQDLAKVADLESAETQAEMGRVLWMQKQPSVAINVLQALCLRGGDATHKALWLAQIGEWKSVARLQSVNDIREQYFETAAELVKDSNSESDCLAAAEVSSKYATFAVSSYRASTKQVAEIDRLEAYSRRKEAESRPISNGRGGESSSDSSRRAVAIVQSQQDRQTVDSFRQSRQLLLETALAMLSRTLAISDSHDDAIFEFTSLWLENASNEAANGIVQMALSSIASHKFTHLFHQLSARLASGVSASASPNRASFQEVLYTLVSQVCHDHPYHSLYQIFFLRGSAPTSKTTASRRISHGGSQAASQVGRAATVSQILQDLRKHDRLRSIVQTLESVLSAYTTWAMLPLDRKTAGRKPRSIPQDQPITKLSNIPIPISTYSLPLDKTTKYDPSTYPCIKSFKSTYTTAGGLRLPKITECVGTDGKGYKQLYKGGDDVRQDAVMEQVFGIANQLLDRDEKTRSRSLAIRTYKVIPLNIDASLLEFVENSQAIGDWLVSAHDAYNQTDMKIAEARKRLGEYAKSPASERVEAYREIMKRIKPVMRHFFMEKHYVPERWFEMRLSYSRSVAVTSMIGHVLGLGDRHVSNIMIDTAKGELVPIDLGIAFEAGRQLPTPELVPFRLTPDIVDGLGISGVEGVFRRCSEEMMRVLRAQSSVFMTILEVFKYDPLQKWAASVEKVRRMQGSQIVDSSRIDGLHQGDGPAYTDADRAIATVANKLSNDLSVEYQVNDLIMQATDINNVGSIFHGWQPYL